MNKIISVNKNNSNSQNHGYVYILSNQSMPGLLNIGMTRSDPYKKVKELSSATGVPTSFNLVYYREFNDCVAAEFEIHSILAARGLRYNDQREFYSIDTTEAINILLSLKNDCVSSQTEETFNGRKDFNSDIDIVDFFKQKELEIKEFENSNFFKEGEDFIYNEYFSHPNPTNEEEAKFKSYVDNGFICKVPFLAGIMSSFDVELQINIILKYVEKGYVSGYIDVIRIYLESINGIDNLSVEKKCWISIMLDEFAINFRNVTREDIYINNAITLYCGISYVLGIEFDKNFYKIIDLDDDRIFDECWLWGNENTDEKAKVLNNKLLEEKDTYLGTNSKLRHEILTSEKYQSFHSPEGLKAYNIGCYFGYGLNGYDRDAEMAEYYWEEAIGKNFKKAYLNLLILYYSDKDKYFEISNKGAMDSCPQCLVKSAARIISGFSLEEEITATTRKRVKRYLDLFESQLELAFYVDKNSCLDSIKTYIYLSSALGFRINTIKISSILKK